MPYEIEASTDGCYEGTTCLINKMGIRDEAELMIATIHAANGVTDYVEQIFRKAIRK